MNPSSSSRDDSTPTASRAALTHRPAIEVSKSDSPSNGSPPIPDEEHGADLPLTMSASVVLSSLPRDAHQALADVEAIDKGKGELRVLHFGVEWQYSVFVHL